MLGVGDETTYLGHLGTMGELNVGMGSVLVIIGSWILTSCDPLQQGDCGTKPSTGRGTNFDGLKMARFNKLVGKNTGNLGFFPSKLHRLKPASLPEKCKNQF